MTPIQKPTQTPADYLVLAISPLLIMLLVGSLSFFLVEVFFRGEAIGSVRWVMFWFVMAVVLVSRIGIEQGTGPAATYGLALAAATWIYLVRIHPAFILGMILLGIVWWGAHKLTWDCTLIDETEDASGHGLLQTAGDKKNFLWFKKTAKAKAGSRTDKAKAKTPHPPGLWVVYFSLAALPLFGIGEKLLPVDNLAARHSALVYLFVYVAAALGLLLATSFLGLRRYLRQRYLPMPPMIAFGWIRFGTGVALFVLLGALLLPRPGANEAWLTLRYQIDHQLRQASDYALRFSPHGRGEGRTGNEADKSKSKNPTADSPTDSKPESGKSPDQTQDPNGTPQSQNAPPPPVQSGSSDSLFHLFKILFLLAVGLLAAWWIYRRRALIFQMARSLIAALRQFWQNLFGSTASAQSVEPAKKSKPRHQRFAAYQNPFLTGKETVWTPEELIIYSYEALQVWAEEHGVGAQPEQTAREFCAELGERFPEMNAELKPLALLYSRAAYGISLSAGSDLEPVKELWRGLAAQN